MTTEKRLDLEAMMRPDLLELEEYTPVEPLDRLSVRLGIPIEQLVKLDANENPYGASPAALEALKNQQYYHIYPDPSALNLREELGKYTGVSKERIFVGSGSDELLELLIRLFISPGDNILDFAPTFGMYSFLGELYRAQIRSVPRHIKDYSIDVEAALAAVDEHTKLIFICTPNNPTGNSAPESVVRALLDTGKIVVVDEAYHDFAGHSFIKLTDEYENLIVLRTFSKLSGLAGLRVGYGIVPEIIARQLWKIKQPYNVTVAGQEAARASLREGNWIAEHVEKIVAERERLYGLLQEFSDYFEALPSSSNFIFCRLKQGSAKLIKSELEKRGVLVRHYNKPLLENAFRVSVGRPEQTDIFIEHLKQIIYTQ
ncbi:MAG: histidinol-phosphate transaminase [Chloroflexi bacterium]|uniref:Histidinol-phosphate aminotransferase n=1 Tax=Candidatus Chlorohelix allophototropha TaxID=3003348 RepID=A0A8T7LYW6_9CHLR|nr:histidinol-phosphate transaminase [Chloroflexota bacterium]WJW65525.1 histidinol-phosphate transaminase [Chloroflexota bacterium L227-S17]